MRRFSLFLLLLVQATQSIDSPELRIEATVELAPIKTRLESFDRKRLSDVVRLVGLSSPGPFIRVELATESSERARDVPPWIAGFALGATNTVVVFPARSPSYPHNTLDDVLRHEVAHVLIHRASAGRPIPRWFNEGLALAAERGWRFGDQTKLLYQLVSGPRQSLYELDRLFQGSQTDQTRAYLLSGALVRELLYRHGETAGGKILERVGGGASFESAYMDATGQSAADAQSEFWNRQRVWTTWMPILFSQETLWMAVTVLAILAIRKRRQKNAEIKKRWEEEGDE